MSEGFKLDPWSSQGLDEAEYDRLIEEFGIERIDELKRQEMINNKFIRRKIIFGHRSLEDIFKAIEKKSHGQLLVVLNHWGHSI